MNRMELTEYTIAGDNEAFTATFYSGEGVGIPETVSARLIAHTDPRCSLSENQADTLRFVAGRLTLLADQICPPLVGRGSEAGLHQPGAV